MGHEQHPPPPFGPDAIPAVDPVAEADALCRRRGARLTALRRSVLEALHRAGRPMGAYELIPPLSLVLGRIPTPQTVYRTLDFLREQGLVTRIESRAAFIPCADPDSPTAPVFLLCRSCGGAAEVRSPDLERVAVRNATLLGFRVDTRVFELHGTCARCLAPDAQAGPGTGRP